MALQTEIINRFGRVVGWNKVRLNLLGRDVEGITSIKYSDSLEIEAVPGAGRYTVGTGEGNYEAEGSITLLAEEVQSLQEALPLGDRIQDIDVGDIVVSFEYNNKTVTDILHGVRFKNNGREVDQGDTHIKIEIELFVAHITYNA